MPKVSWFSKFLVSLIIAPLLFVSESVFAITPRIPTVDSNGNINISQIAQDKSNIFSSMNFVNWLVFFFIIISLVCIVYFIWWNIAHRGQKLPAKIKKGIIGVYVALFGVGLATVGKVYFQEYTKVNITENCVMNGFGMGKCTFTNLGNMSSHKCGYILVKNKSNEESEMSGVLCSGDIPAKDSKILEFSVGNVRSLCEVSPEKSWSDVCSFDFVERE